VEFDSRAKPGSDSEKDDKDKKKERGRDRKRRSDSGSSSSDSSRRYDSFFKRIVKQKKNVNGGVAILWT
jgi:hypothetical protein